MKVQIKGWIVFGMYEWDTNARYNFFDYKPSGATHVPICEHTIEIDVPEDADPREQIATNLQNKKRALEAEFHKRVTEINQQIQSLLAIEG